MKPPPFSYHRPHNANEALALLGSLDNAKLLAGGQSLMPMMNYRYVMPDHLIDLNHCHDLSGIQVNGDRLVIGAMTRQRDIAEDRLVQQHAPLLVDALHWVGHVQTRNRGTLGGSLSHLDPAAELPGVLAAYDAKVTVASKTGSREISIHDWGAGYMMPAIDETELAVAVNIPLDSSLQNHAHAFVEVARRHGDFAQAGAGVVLASTDPVDAAITDARIALVGVDLAPLRLREAEHYLIDKVATSEVIETAAQFASDVPGIADVHADESYRKRLAVVVVRRALQQATGVDS